MNSNKSHPKPKQQYCTRGHFTGDLPKQRNCPKCNIIKYNERSLNPAVLAERRYKYRENKLRHYGITIADYDAMVHAQGGKCAACHRTPVIKNRNPLFIDHDHATGLVRGLLCHKCNCALGLLSDSPLLIKKLERYVAKWAQLAISATPIKSRTLIELEKLVRYDRLRMLPVYDDALIEMRQLGDEAITRRWESFVAEKHQEVA